MSAEYILSGGNMNVMVCERGIRTYETATRNTFDINAIPVLKELTHLPVVADPSHGTGMWQLVGRIALAAVAAGADALMIEVHPDPARAWSDGAQSLTPDRFPLMARPAPGGPSRRPQRSRGHGSRCANADAAQSTHARPY